MDPITIILGTSTLVLGILLGLVLDKWLKALNEINRKETVIIREKSNRRDVGVQYFAEEELSGGLFSSKHIIRYKMQLLVDNLPIGMPTEFRRDSYKKIDKDEVNKVLDQFAQPLLQAGVQVLVKKLTA
ncbi:MAG: hypothetical protein HBSIN02_24720 [Bacteroidia bacterium]|nr:MAG: hypothetical protein HBSIN02_24720 [Bacteroidia bacterium]